MIGYNYSTNDPSVHNLFTGGELQGQTSIFDNFRQVTIKQQSPPLGEEKVKPEYDVIRNHFNRLNCPITLNPQAASFDDVAMHAILRQRLMKSTVEKRLRYARFMENHIIPVDFRNPSFENFVRHMDYREQIENAGYSALTHEWKTMKMFLKAYGVPLTDWNYKPPSCPQSKARIIPLPDVVYKLVHHRYSSDEYENALVQYTLLHTFMIGWRNPSETCMMTTDDVKLDRGILIITEPKKNKTKRIIVPEKALMTGKTRKSFKNWIDHWRPKVENQYSGDALYLRPDGRPIAIDQYRMFIIRMVKPLFSEFTPYVSRHWCAIGKLIKSKLETKKFDEYEVRDWLGHSEIQTTMSYLRDTKQYMRLALYDWFKRVLKYYKKPGMIEDNTLNQNNS